MSVIDLVGQLRQASATVEAEGGRLRVRALFEESPLSEKTVAVCRAHRDELLAYALYAEKADRLILEFSRRLSKAWPPGCQLDDNERWERAERELLGAYGTLDMEQLRKALSSREQVALEVFASFGKEQVG